jgi:hypothetical protein
VNYLRRQAQARLTKPYDLDIPPSRDETLLELWANQLDQMGSVDDLVRMWE